MGQSKKLKGDQLVIPELSKLTVGDFVSCTYGSRCPVYYVSQGHVWVYVSPRSVRAVRREAYLEFGEAV